MREFVKEIIYSTCVVAPSRNKTLDYGKIVVDTERGNPGVIIHNRNKESVFIEKEVVGNLAAALLEAVNEIHESFGANRMCIGYESGTEFTMTIPKEDIFSQRLSDAVQLAVAMEEFLTAALNEGFDDSELADHAMDLRTNILAWIEEEQS